MEFVLGIDLGTSYFKFVLIDPQGSVCGSSRIAVPVDSPFAEQQIVDPASFERVIYEGIAGALRQAGGGPEDIRGIGYSSQANSFMLADSNDNPLTPIILWSDRRVSAPGNNVTELWDRGDFLGITATAIKGSESAVTKLDWIRRTDPAVWQRVSRVFSLPELMTYLFTGEAVGDQSTASLLGLWDLKRSTWWSDGLDAIGARESWMCSLLPPGSPCGRSKGPLAKKLGLPGKIPYAVGALDHYAAAVGAGLGFHAETSESTGTVVACLQLEREYLPDTFYCIGPTDQDKLYYRLAFGPNGARSIEWYRDQFAKGRSLEELSLLAGRSPAGANGLCAPESAYESDDLSRFVSRPEGEHSAGDYIRSIMESTARSLGELLGRLRPERPPSAILSTGGGARSDAWLQVKSDMLDIEVRAGSNQEPGAYGAAIFGSVAAGWYRSVREAIESFVSIERVFRPRVDTHRFYVDWKVRYESCFPPSGSN